MKKMMIVLAALASFSVFADEAATSTEASTKMETTTAANGTHEKKVKKNVKKKSKSEHTEVAPATTEAPAPH